MINIDRVESLRPQSLLTSTCHRYKQSIRVLLELFFTLNLTHQREHFALNSQKKKKNSSIFEALQKSMK